MIIRSDGHTGRDQTSAEDDERGRKTTKPPENGLGTASIRLAWRGPGREHVEQGRQDLEK